MSAGSVPAPGPLRDDEGAADELRLVTAARAGDQLAFRRLWEPVERPAYALCLRVTGQHADAADALQDAQIATWRNLHRFEGRCPFGAWVLVIARNAALGVIRARNRRSETPVDTVDDARPAPAASADSVIERMRLDSALAQLPRRHCEAVLLWAQGCTYPQVAALMGVPVGSVRAWIHRARTALRVALAD